MEAMNPTPTREAGSMDQATFGHLTKWLMEHVREDQQFDTLNTILDFVREYPHVLGDRGWREILNLAERTL
jgi:hypothetical protein